MTTIITITLSEAGTVEVAYKGLPVAVAVGAIEVAKHMILDGQLTTTKDSVIEKPILTIFKPSTSQ